MEDLAPPLPRRVGSPVGYNDVGRYVGIEVGFKVGWPVGTDVGVADGEDVGL